MTKRDQSIFWHALQKSIIASIITFCVYQFFYIEFIRSSIEDFAFDTINKIALSQKPTKVATAPNIIILMVDNHYLRSTDLIDENNETRYGYIFPREYLASIINSIDETLSSIDPLKHPKALFIDYDLSYTSDPLNQTLSSGDIALIEALQKERTYTIYLPMTSSYNFIYDSKNPDLQQKIRDKKIVFVSTGLALSGDDISRRYYPYEHYKDQLFINIAIELWKQDKKDYFETEKMFSQTKTSLIENRIILKEKEEFFDGTYMTWQSRWSNLMGFSAHFPLDTLDEDVLQSSVLMLGAAHEFSNDVFGTSLKSKKNGVELHGESLMTLYYLDGNLQKLSLWLTLLIVFLTVFGCDYLFGMIFKPLLQLRKKSKQVFKLTPTKLISIRYKLLSILIAVKREKFQDNYSIWVATAILFFISYIGLVYYRIWFNWMIPAILSNAYLGILLLRQPRQKISNLLTKIK
ncbi:hypothetical protein SUSP_000378 [Sulfurospirillum sp. 'SP']|nr:hypothetical protein [Sulfurospirillum sp. 'SP']WNY97960.1 hypothetical protein SUSP_000378 [Sulfurospirillum sp. 'SP']